MSRTLCLILAIITSASAQAQSGPPRATQRGHAWVRSHPYTIMGLVRNYPSPFNLKQYRGAGFNALLAWEPGSYSKLLPKVAKNRMPFFVHLEHWGGKLTNNSKATEGSLRTAVRAIDSKKNRDYIASVTKNPGCIGFLANDEAVNPFYLRYTRQLLKWLRRKHPDKLAFGNAHPDPHGGGYDRYIDEFAAMVEPDILMTDVYPLSVPDGLAYNYFAILSDIRKTALAHGMPYWMFIQSFQTSGRFDRRLPSESDIRLQMFVPLTFGYTGIVYFTYDVAFERGVIDKSGKPNRLYPDAKKANREVANIGRAMRFLTSTDYGCIVGRHKEKGKIVINKTQRRPRPMKLDPKKHSIKNVTIESVGKWKDVMLGFFVDDHGGKYFMVTNLWHNAGASAKARALPVTVQLAGNVKELHRLNRITGKVERVKLNKGTLRLTLPGGTGDLFKINDGKFPGLGK